jgi:hypothetical protein
VVMKGLVDSVLFIKGFAAKTFKVEGTSDFHK